MDCDVGSDGRADEVDTGHGERKLEIQFLQRRASYIKGTAFDRGREVTTHHP
jgi:hypothetical protein